MFGLLLTNLNPKSGLREQTSVDVSTVSQSFLVLSCLIYLDTEARALVTDLELRFCQRLFAIERPHFYHQILVEVQTNSYTHISFFVTIKKYGCLLHIALSVVTKATLEGRHGKG